MIVVVSSHHVLLNRECLLMNDITLCALCVDDPGLTLKVLFAPNPRKNNALVDYLYLFYYYFMFIAVSQYSDTDTTTTGTTVRSKATRRTDGKGRRKKQKDAVTLLENDWMIIVVLILLGRQTEGTAVKNVLTNRPGVLFRTSHHHPSSSISSFYHSKTRRLFCQCSTTKHSGRER